MSGLLQLIGETKSVILRHLLNGEATAESIAAHIGMNSSVIRRHLNDLQAAGLVNSRFERIGKGRPKKVYILSLEGRELFSLRYHTLLNLMIKQIAGKNKEEIANITKQLARKLVIESGVGKDDALGFLRWMGFYPEELNKGGKRIFISRNCPVIRVACEYPYMICDSFHGQLIKEITGGKKVKLKQSIALNADICVHEVEN